MYAIGIKSVMNEIPVPQICLQECTVNGQTVNTPNYGENASFSAYQTFPGPVPLSGPPNLQCQLTTIHTLAQPPTSVSKSVHRMNYPPHQMQPVPAPPMYFSNFPPNAVMPSTSSLPFDPYYYGSQPYFQGYRPQIQTPPLPAPVPNRPYLTIMQYNYQPVGYSQMQNQPPVNNSMMFAPPPRDRRCGLDNLCRKTEKLKIKPESSTSFEFSIQPEHIVSSLCGERDNPTRNSEDSNTLETPRLWTDFESIDTLRIEDDELTKFIVDGCMKAESIAVRNQHRPCFKNIKHLCTRTRTDILKPRTTVANIHSQGIPWATKDFIFAYVRLINCWYILKGYLDDHEGSLGKIDQALTSEFKDCYQRWQTVNKEMVKHLINIFVNLDTGISVQNAEIYSTFNQTRKLFPKSLSERNMSGYKPYNDSEDRQNDTSNVPLDFDKLKYSEGKNVPGILRLNNPPKNYMKPGSYRFPNRPPSDSPVLTPRQPEIDVWRRPPNTANFFDNRMNYSDSNSDDSSSGDDSDQNSKEKTQDWVKDHYKKFSFNLSELLVNTRAHASEEKDRGDEDNEV